MEHSILEFDVIGSSRGHSQARVQARGPYLILPRKVMLKRAKLALVGEKQGGG